MAQPFFTGVTTAGINPDFLANLQKAVIAAGGTGVVLTSGKRDPGLQHNDVKNSNHITGDAIDGYAIIGGKQVPIGQALLHVAPQFGLRSGDVAGFDPKTAGGYDPIHVDDGANVGMTSPGSTPTTTSQVTSTVGSAEDEFIKQVSQQTGVAPSVLQLWAKQEGAYAPNGTGGFNFLNLRPYSSDTGVASISSGNFDRFGGLAGAVASTVARIKQPFLQQYLGKAGSDPAAQWNAIKQSGWDKGHYAGVNFSPSGSDPYSSQTIPSSPGGTAGAPAGSQSPTGPTQATLLSAVTQPPQQQIATQHIQGAGTGLALQLLDSAQNMLNGGGGNLSSLFAAAKGYQQANKSVKPALGGSALQVKSGGLSF